MANAWVECPWQVRPHLFLLHFRVFDPIIVDYHDLLRRLLRPPLRPLPWTRIRAVGSVPVANAFCRACISSFEPELLRVSFPCPMNGDRACVVVALLARSLTFAWRAGGTVQGRAP